MDIPPVGHAITVGMQCGIPGFSGSKLYSISQTSWHAIIVIIQIGIIANSVAISIHPFRPVKREGIHTGTP
jgi:hypothetical protein